MSETVLVLHPYFKVRDSVDNPDDALEEACGLTAAINLSVVDSQIIGVSQIQSGHFFGKGTRERLASEIEDQEIDLLMVNHALSPVQQRNLETDLKCKVIDRTGLILEIFGARAQTKEGKIQVDLAQLQYQRSRLVRSWTHLERQRGGAGFMGGPGERQIELDRRMIDERITLLKKDLEKVRKTRELGREARQKVPFPVIALVGYTNAGKSTLFNYLTGAEVFAEDLLFATLDPTMRQIKLPTGQNAIISDTVGFISNLPTQLVESFKATLEQVQYADVILHVRDLCQENFEDHRDDVVKIMKDLDIDYDSDERIIEVLNKTDAASEERLDEAERLQKSKGHIVCVSSYTGEGTELLLEKVANCLTKNWHQCLYNIANTDGKAIAWLYEHAHVIKMTESDDLMSAMVSIPDKNKARFERLFEYEQVNQS